MAEKDYKKKLEWDKDGERFYETGVKQCVLYLKKNVTSDETHKPYNNGVAWNGVTSISENPSGAETTKLYADDIAYLSLTSNEEFGATIEAYMSPEEFDTCDGSAELASGVSIGQQERDVFGLCYKTVLGNDEDGNSKGYKLHLVYGAKAAPASKAYTTINDSPEAITLSWEVTTTPVAVPGKKPTAIITIDSTKASASNLQKLEDILYGKDPISGGDGVAPRLPLPEEIQSIFAQG